MLALFLYPQYARKEVNAMPYIPKDQIVAAREMDLLTYLRRFEPKSWCISAGTPTLPAPTIP